MKSVEKVIKEQQNEINSSKKFGEPQEVLTSKCIDFVEKSMKIKNIIDYIYNEYVQHIKSFLSVECDKDHKILFMENNTKSEKYSQFELKRDEFSKTHAMKFGGAFDNDGLILQDEEGIIGMSSDPTLAKLAIFNRLKEKGFIDSDVPMCLASSDTEELLYIPSQDLLWVQSKELFGEPSLIDYENLDHVSLIDKVDLNQIMPEDECVLRIIYKHNVDKNHDANIQYRYGLMCLNGQGGKIDETEASIYFKKAADQEHMEANYEYAMACLKQENLSEASLYFKKVEDISDSSSFSYSEGQVTKRHESQYQYGVICLKENKFDEARTYLLRASSSHHMEAKYRAGMMLLNGEGGAKDLRRARELFKDAALDGKHLPAQYQYALMCLEHAMGGKISPATGLDYLKDAADKNYAAAAFKYAALCVEGYNEAGTKLNIDIEKAVKYFKVAVDNGHAEAETLSRHYLKIAADKNNELAQYHYGFMCYKGKGGQADFNEARKYLKLAAEQNFAQAQLEYAQMCRRGEGGNINLDEARKYLKLAADQNYVQAQNEYGEMCFRGEGGQVDFNEARKYFKLAADKGSPWAQALYGVMCHTGKGGNINLDEARKYSKLAAEQNHKLAQNMYAYMCRRGEGGNINLDEARKYFKLAADENSAQAQFEYGEMCQKGEGGQVDFNEARKYLKLAADQNHKLAQNMYAQMCRRGEGGNINLDEARKYLKLAADQNYAQAQFEYGEMCQKGEGGQVDFNEARTYLKRAADQNHDKAPLEYALMCLRGEGGGVEIDEARRYFKLAADKKNMDASSIEASFFYAESCLKVNTEDSLLEARKYFQHAANQKHIEAQYNYGNMCMMGKGGLTDYNSARHYLKLAADQNHAMAQYKYGFLCFKGKDGYSNFRDAKEYLKFAASNASSSPILKEHAEARLTELKQMTKPDDQAEPYNEGKPEETFRKKIKKE